MSHNVWFGSSSSHYFNSKRVSTFNAINALSRAAFNPATTFKELWGPTHQEDTHYLRILVGKLRSKLGDNAIQPRYIATEPGVGLRFLAKQKNH